jgi:acyl-CoA-dependent ceramide synthase
LPLLPLTLKTFLITFRANTLRQGPRDITFVAFYTVVLSFAREFLMQRLIRPMAMAWGIRGRAKQSRFMEQVYTAMYFAIFGPYGMYVMSHRHGTSILRACWRGTPQDAGRSLQSLLSATRSYWAQQAIVLMLQLEAKEGFQRACWTSYRHIDAYSVKL